MIIGIMIEFFKIERQKKNNSVSDKDFCKENGIKDPEIKP